MAVEHAPEGKKGLFGSLPQVGVAPGLILSSLAMGAVSRLPEADMLSWAGACRSWPACSCCWWAGTSAPRSANRPSSRPRWPSPARGAAAARRAARSQGAGAGRAGGLHLGEDLVLHHRDLLADLCGRHAGPAARDYPERRDLARAAALVTIPLFGWLGDRCSKQAIFIAGALGISLFSAGFFALLDEKTAYHTNVAMLVAFGVVYAAMYAQESSLFASMFPPEVRYTGISLAVQIGGAIGGGTAPLVATYLLAQGGGSPRLIVFYLAGLGVVAAVCGLMMRPYRQPLAQAGAPFASGRAGKRVAPLASR